MGPGRSASTGADRPKADFGHTYLTTEKRTFSVFSTLAKELIGRGSATSRARSPRCVTSASTQTALTNGVTEDHNDAQISFLLSLCPVIS
jgi:hypothetical protein